VASIVDGSIGVWDSVEALPPSDADGPGSAIWYVAPGETPTLAEGRARLAFLERHGPSPYAFRLGDVPKPLLVSRTTLSDEQTIALVLRLNEELAALYPEPGANHFTLDPESVLPPNGVMVRADLEGVPVGCGAIRVLEDGQRAEVKRMFVDPATRGQKIGAAVLERLESEARRLGVSELVLETGIRQHAAIGLYERAGFEPTPLWGEYLRSRETSRCYRKPLP
jgi:GNAT superfamily N-acetyltransferase